MFDIDNNEKLNIDDLNLPMRYKETIKYAKDYLSQSSVKDYIKDIILYGSCAREKVKYNSDVDILVIIDNTAIQDCNIRETLLELKSTLGFGENNLIDVDLKILSEDSFDNDNSFFVKNIKKEGVKIWNPIMIMQMKTINS